MRIPLPYRVWYLLLLSNKYLIQIRFSIPPSFKPFIGFYSGCVYTAIRVVCTQFFGLCVHGDSGGMHTVSGCVHTSFFSGGVYTQWEADSTQTTPDHRLKFPPVDNV